MNELELLRHAAKWTANHIPESEQVGFGYYITGEITRDSRYVELSDWGTLYERYLDKYPPRTDSGEWKVRI
jgi:hypothetical protein